MTAYNVISPASMQAGQPEDVSVVKSNFDAIAAVLNGNIDNSNINAAAAIAKSKLAALAIVDADISGTAAIAKSKLAALAIANADVAGGAAIAYSKLALAASLKRSDMATGITGPEGTQLDYVEVPSNQTSTATTAAGATAVITGSTFAYDGATPVWVTFYCPGVFNSVANTVVNFQLYDGATDLGTIATGPAGPAFGNTILAQRKLTPSNASHTYSIRAWSSAASTATMRAGAGGAGVLLPAFLMVVVA